MIDLTDNTKNVSGHKNYQNVGHNHIVCTPAMRIQKQVLAQGALRSAPTAHRHQQCKTCIS